MDQAGLRQFARRDWAAAAAAKLDYWAKQYRSRGPAAARQAASQLWQHARAVQPVFPAMPIAVAIWPTMSICASDWTAPLVPSPVADLLADLAAALRLGCAYRVTTGTSTRDG